MKPGHLLLPLLLLSTAALSANETSTKQALKTNGQLVYNEKAPSVDNLSSMFKEGVFYGRVRSHTFYYNWDLQDSSHDSHFITGVGASLIYNSAKLSKIDFGVGLYGSQAYFNTQDDPFSSLKAGKDLLSRFDYSNTGSKGMGVLGQAYLRYSGVYKSEFIVGRQLVETFYTKSNDTKMIPNTFDALVFSSKAIPDTSVKMGYLYKQKLRDHTQSHGVLVYGDVNSSASKNAKWSENDDAAMHKGLTYSALKAAGKPTDAPLITGDIHNKSIANLKADASFYIVPELLSQVLAELNYSFKLGNNFSITPGLRYIKQFDNGAGAVGGASYINNTTGYKNANSLESQMIAARVVTKIDNYKINLGYSQVFDEGDLIAPWRGFPTAGYTRSMGRYNWRANTKSYRLELVRNANSKGVYKDTFIQASILYTEGDESKVGILDEFYYYIGFVQNLESLSDLQWRLRLGYADYRDSKYDKLNNLDARFEINYLF